MRYIIPVSSLVVVLALLLPACAGRQKNIRIPKVAESEAVLAMMEEYRQAMEARDPDRILALTSTDYLDSRGSLEPDDDLDQAGLRAKLKTEFKKISALRLNLEVLKLTFDEDRHAGALELRYDLRFQLEMQSGSTWHNELNVHRMELRLEDGGWRVTNGL